MEEEGEEEDIAIEGGQRKNVVAVCIGQKRVCAILEK